jgi:putative ABC transport system permease protein
MFFRVLRESVVRAKGRWALAVIAIALGTAVATAMLALSLTAGDRLSRELRAFGANISVTPASDSLPVEIGGVDYRPVAEGSYLFENDLPKLKTIFWRNAIVAFAPYLYVPATLGDGRHVVLTGTWFDHSFKISNGEKYRTGVKDTNPNWKVEGAWPSDEGKPQALVGRSLGMHVGGEIDLPLNPAGTKLKVSGILTTGGAEDAQIFVPLAFAQQLAGKPGQLRSLQVSALTEPEDAFARRDPAKMSPADFERWRCSPYISSIIYDIQGALPGTTGRQVRQVEQSDEQVLKRIRLLLLLVTGLALGASALAVSSATAAVVMERRGEIALMKAIGSSQWLVSAFFLAETALQGLVGGAAGYAAGYYLASLAGQQVFGAPATPPAVVLPLVLPLAVAVSWIGAAAPLRAALSVQPAIVLKEAR